MELTETMKTVFIETAKMLTGATRRLFMARTVKMLGYGGMQRAENELGWNRGTLRKGLHELESGLTCIDNTSARTDCSAEDTRRDPAGCGSHLPETRSCPQNGAFP